MVDRCPFCDAYPTEKPVRAREMMFGLRHYFTYSRCSGCGSLWLADIPEDLASYYGDGYYSMAAPVVASRGSAARCMIRMLLKAKPFIVDRVAGKPGFPIYLRWFRGANVSLSSRIADIGSGEGHLVMRMVAHGFEDVWGFDPFIQSDRDDGNAHIRKMGIEQAENRFDVIMFNHSLEHVQGPIEALRNALSRLAADGIILVRVPLASSFADRHYGADWMSLDPPRHLNVPSRLGMQAAAAASGLQITRVFYDSLPQQIWASEQYQQDIPLFDDRSARDQQVSKELSRRTRELNRAEDGDRAGFILRAT